MTYVVYFANSGTPTTGLTLSWSSLKTVSDGNDFTPQPSFSQIGGGWYKFDWSGTSDIVGVIDGSASLSTADRYVPIYLSAQDEFDKTVWTYQNRTLGNS